MSCQLCVPYTFDMGGDYSDGVYDMAAYLLLIRALRVNHAGFPSFDSLEDVAIWFLRVARKMSRRGGNG